MEYRNGIFNWNILYIIGYILLTKNLLLDFRARRQVRVKVHRRVARWAEERWQPGPALRDWAKMLQVNSTRAQTTPRALIWCERLSCEQQTTITTLTTWTTITEAEPPITTITRWARMMSDQVDYNPTWFFQEYKIHKIAIKDDSSLNKMIMKTLFSSSRSLSSQWRLFRCSK